MTSPALIVLGPVFSTVTSALKLTGVVCADVLFARFGSVVPFGGKTVTVLLTAVVALLATIASTVIVILLAAPEFKLMALSAIAPVPFALLPALSVSQSAAPVATQVHVIDAKPTGSASFNEIPLAFDGPMLIKSI
jgi:hypothetical protein